MVQRVVVSGKLVVDPKKTVFFQITVDMATVCYF